jgi:hypothetical protein
VTLRATAPDGKVMVSKSPVAVALAASDRTPVAALAAPKPPAAAPQSPAAASDLSKAPGQAASKEAELRIESVEPEAGGGLFVSGRAAPGSRIRLYLNEGYIAMGTASPEGRVSFSIQSGVRPGDYRIRLDQIGASDTVAARVEMPFRAPATVAALTPSAPAKTPEAPAAPDSVVASKQPEREPTPAASPASPPQSSAVTEQKPAAPAATPSQASPLQPSAPVPAPKDLASGPATEPLPRSAAALPPAASPVASAQPSTPDATRPAQPSASAVEPSARSAQIGKTDAPASQPASPVVAAPATEPKVASNMSPRIAGPAKDRRDAVIIPRIDTRLIVRGDNLWRISEATYGLGKRYTVIFGANRDKIRDPDLIYPGQIFVLPKSRSKQ